MDAKKFYDKSAHKYDARHDNDTIKHMQKFEERFIRKHAKGKTLDIGCGTGRSLLWLDNAVGCDPSLEMLRIARNKTNFPLVQCEAEQLPYKDDSFDSVTCIFTVLNLCDYETAANEMNRVLKKGGAAVVSVASIWDKKDSSLLEKMLIKSKSERINVRIEKERLRFHLFSKEDFINVFERNGFALRDFKGLFFLQKPYWGWYRSFTLTERTKLFLEQFLRFSFFNNAARMYFAVFEKR